MIKLTKDKVLLIHELIAKETGGGVGVRDEGLLDSALESIFGGIGDQEFYPTKEEKAARLGYLLITNHALVDGNKRIGMHVMLSFLELNGVSIDCTNEDIVEAGMNIAKGEMSYEDVLSWVHSHTSE